MGILRTLKKRTDDARLKRAHRVHRRGNGEAYARIDAIVAHYRSNGGLDNRWQHYKLFCLRELLRESNPRRILELGSGTTTAVFADYVRTAPEAHLTVLDESAHWLANARQIAGIEPSPQFDLQAVPAQRVKRGELFSYDYDWTSAEAFDFILIDGPSRHKEQTAINGNILDLLDSRPHTIVVDGRKAVALLLNKTLSGYRCELSEIFEKRFYPGYRYFSIFTALEPGERGAA